MQLQHQRSLWRATRRLYPDRDKIGVAVAEYYGAIFVDGSSCYDHGHRSFDGLPMNAYGHQVVAARLFPVIERLLSANGRRKRSMMFRTRRRSL
jgi:hypothetical protein